MIDTDRRMRRRTEQNEFIEQTAKWIRIIVDDDGPEDRQAKAFFAMRCIASANDLKDKPSDVKLAQLYERQVLEQVDRFTNDGSERKYVLTEIAIRLLEPMRDRMRQDWAQGIPELA